ncbi:MULTISPECIES: pyridoxamine 5'-phosphate oxidase family protein [unclassified Streptomyces]|uniref:pyridoxamine 5'-phosphate oxidase family protein n=1 Tax=unclassified Streptomyces TaxID=2593676 RepID=UPI0022718296|nr:MULTISPECIES: pyridoxamine 5'-phosphate oxidase family protein [unclassified Streptomyces]MCY0922367.1 pyridoxamine 5'-phosphate oxidase family protein [Streptomyces sp. H27-G5]MCY0956736.1 pyridoxamine 5'-phosphate oxidase family protein [Streptomyces sp. H27-H5]
MQTTELPRRTVSERRRDALERLVAERDVWVSTAHPDHGPHQVPLWFSWDGQAVWMCTAETSATARNVRKEPRVRLSLPDTFDVLLLQGEAEWFTDQDVPADAADAFTGKFGWDPRTENEPYLYVRVTPKTMRAWRGEAELRGRVLMREGTWLE